MSCVSNPEPPDKHHMRAKNTLRSQPRQDGLSLVELMVAMSVSLVLLGGFIQIFVHNKNAYRLQDELGFLQTNGRAALAELGDHLRIADHWGSTDPADIKDSIGGSITGVGGCNRAWITNVGEGVRGYEGAANIGSVSGFPSGCINAAHYLPNSDIIVVRYADPTDPVPSASLSSHGSNVFVRTLVGRGAALMMGSDGVPATLPNQDGAYNFHYRMAVYHLRPCAIVNTDNSCTDGVPTLVRMVLNGNSLTTESLVYNIEQLQFEYGLDGNSDGDVDRYQNATAVSNWNQVQAVRLSLLTRTEIKDLAFNDTSTYAMLGYNHTVPSTAGNHHRRQFTKLIQIRNRARQ